MVVGKPGEIVVIRLTQFTHMSSASDVGRTHLFIRGADIDGLAVLVVRIELVIVDAAILDGVLEDLRIHHAVLEPHAFATTN